MKTIQFTGTEYEIDNLEFALDKCDLDLKTETRVYVVDVHSVVNKHHSDLTDEQFMNLAEAQGTIYTLKYFQEDFNIGKYEMHYIIRFISVPLY